MVRSTEFDLGRTFSTRPAESPSEPSGQCEARHERQRVELEFDRITDLQLADVLGVDIGLQFQIDAGGGGRRFWYK